MLFERIGLFFLSKIHPAFLFVLISLPLVFTGIHIFQRRLEIADLNDQYESTILKAYKSLDKRSRKEQFLTRYSDTQPYFLDQNIESMILLKKEIDLLKAYKEHPALSEKELVESRLSYLTEGKNRISFIEEAIRSSNICKETEEKMKRAVEMDEEDLKKLLSLLENIPIDSHESNPKSPQLIITDFYLKRKYSPLNQEIFQIKLDLLKREFIKS